MLALVVIGKGVAGLQAAGWVNVNPIWAPCIDVLGIYPTLEAVSSQIVMLVIALAGFGLILVSARKPQAV